MLGSLKLCWMSAALRLRLDKEPAVDSSRVAGVAWPFAFKWRWLTVAVNQATISLHDTCSKTTLENLERSSSSAEVAVNAEALPGSSLKRTLSVVDTAAKRKAAKPQVSRFAHALPSFVGVKVPHWKPHSELESIRQKNAQLGMQPAAGQRHKTGASPSCKQTQESQQRQIPPICMVLLSDSRTEVEHRHLPPLLQHAHSTKKLEAGQHRKWGQIPQPLVARKGRGERPGCPKAW